MYDLIVVGAGTAGCVLADRLTRSGFRRVLLIEAGGDPSNSFVRIPAGFAKLFRTSLDWNFESEPQCGEAARRIYVPRGRMLGGSSNINAQIHQWCHPADFAEWVEAGARGWGWDDVSPIFQRQEKWLGDDGQQGRGDGGPMQISPNRHAHRMSHAFVTAARAAGMGDMPRYNGEAYSGAWIAELAHKDGQRFSAYDAFLKPAMRRPNLDILRNGLVTRINFENGEAAGVTVRQEGVEIKHRAAVGVILAAGAFGSPQLLMNSGVGPANHLAELGIPVLLDSPEVGANLQDHPMSAVIFRTRGKDTFKNAESPINLLKYILFKRGMLASNAAEAISFAPVHGGPGAPPDIEILFAPFEWKNQGLSNPEIHAFSFGIGVIAPRSRGSLRLRSPKPEDAPLIDFGLLTDPEGLDAKALRAAARLARKIARTAPLADFAADEFFPGVELQTDEQLQPVLNSEMQTVYHPTSTCRMGSDPRAVVGPDLRLNGLGKLWIADASVMPRIPRGHPNAVVAMIAERAAQWAGV